MNHLSRDEVLTALEGGSAADAHLAGCDACRERVEELRRVLALAREEPVPEPSPLFWAHFSERVREAVADDAAAQSVSLWRRTLLVPTGAIGTFAIILLTLAVVGRQAPTSAPPVAMSVEDSAGGAFVDSDDSWTLVSDMAGELDWEAAGEAGLGIQPGVAERALGELSQSEKEWVAEMLQQALAHPGSNSL